MREINDFDEVAEELARLDKKIDGINLDKKVDTGQCLQQGNYAMPPEIYYEMNECINICLNIVPRHTDIYDRLKKLSQKHV